MCAMWGVGRVWTLYEWWLRPDICSRSVCLPTKLSYLSRSTIFFIRLILVSIINKFSCMADVAQTYPETVYLNDTIFFNIL